MSIKDDVKSEENILDFNYKSFKKAKNKVAFVGWQEAKERKKWVLIDAKNLIVGRLAVVI